MGGRGHGDNSRVGKFIKLDTEYGVDDVIKSSDYWFVCFQRHRDPAMTLHIPCAVRWLDAPVNATELCLRVEGTKLCVDTDFAISRQLLDTMGISRKSVLITEVIHENIPNTLRRVIVRGFDLDSQQQLLVPTGVAASEPKGPKGPKAKKDPTDVDKKFEDGFAALAPEKDPVIGAVKCFKAHLGDAAKGVVMEISDSGESSDEDDQASLKKLDGALKKKGVKPTKDVKLGAKAPKPPTPAKDPPPAEPLPLGPIPIPLPLPVPKSPTLVVLAEDQLPPPIAHAGPERGPKLFAALDPEHPFFWLTRTNRKARCSNPDCKYKDKKISGYEVRALYHPDKAMVKDLRVWGKRWWKYYHLDTECLKTVPILGLRIWAAQVDQGIERLIIDFAPLPKKKKETHDQLSVAQSDGKAKLLELIGEIQSSI